VTLLRRARLCVALIGLASLAEAQGNSAEARHWVLVGTTADTTYYVDSAFTVTTRDDLIDVWTKAEFARVIAERYGNSYNVRIARHRIDCAKGMWRGTGTEYYQGTTFVRRTMASTRSTMYAPRRQPEQMRLLATACRMAAEKRQSK
jgi:hypothetical protein